MKKFGFLTFVCVTIFITFLYMSCAKTNLSDALGGDFQESIDGKTNDPNIGSDGGAEEPDEENPIVEAVQDFADINEVDVYGLSSVQQTQIGMDIISSSVDLLESYGIEEDQLIEVFGSVNDSYIGAVGLLLEAYKANEIYNNSSSNPCESRVKTIKCLTSALVPCTIITTALNTLTGAATKMDKTWALGVINDMVRMSVNYATPAGIVLMAADFSLCMVLPGESTDSNEDVDGGQGDDDGSEYSVIPDMSFVFYIDRLEDFNRADEPNDTALFFNIDDNKYYNDSSYVNLARTTYYIVNIDDSLHKIEYYYIANGIISNHGYKNFIPEDDNIEQ